MNPHTTSPPRPRLLLVEADTKVLGFLVYQLLSRGFEIVATGSLAEAKQFLEYEEFGAILIDPDLPDGDGLTLLGDAPLERVVLLTSHAKLRHVTGWPRGRVFVKPFDIEGLVAKLDEILRFWPK